jgi:hypothetical protein
MNVYRDFGRLEGIVIQVNKNGANFSCLYIVKGPGFLRGEGMQRSDWKNKDKGMAIT